MELASFLDSTLLKPESTSRDIASLCHEAKENAFYAVCVSPYRLAQARELLQGSPVRLCTVIGFPLGAETIAVKAAAARQCLREGAHELDLVANIGAIKDGSFAYLEEETRAVLELKQEKDYVLKCIIETALLDRAELETMVRMLARLGVDFVKTSTGYAARGASREDINAIKEARGASALKIKASGGIRDLDSALALIAAGADRIGTSSAGAILAEYRSRSRYEC